MLESTLDPAGQDVAAPELPPGAAGRAMGGPRTVAILIATQIVISLSMVAVWKLAVIYWGADQLGEYLLTRRVINVLQLPLVCIVQLGLIRYGSMARVARDHGRGQSLLVASTLIAALLSLVTLVALNTWPDLWAEWLFGLPRNRALVFAGSLATVGLLVHSVAWSELWTRMSVGAASLLLILTLGITPLAVFLIPHQNVAGIVIATAIAWLVINGAVLTSQLAHVDLHALQPASVRIAAALLLRYGLPRAPGGLASAALFSAPVILASHFGDLLSASFVGTGVSLLSMATLATKPFTQAVLPTTSRMLASRDFASVRRAAWQFAMVGIGGTLAVVAAAELLLPTLITWYLGDEFASATDIFRMLLVAAIPYLVFILLRDFLDALEERPLNARNQLVALGVFLVLAMSRRTVEFIPPALTVSLSLLAVLTLLEFVRTVRQMTRISPGAIPASAEAA